MPGQRSFSRVLAHPAWNIAAWCLYFSAVLQGPRRGPEGLVGPRPHHFFCATAPHFAQNRKIIKINEKDLKQFFFPSIFRYILYIFFNFKRQAFCGAPVLFTVIVPWGRLAPWSNAMPWPPLRFVRQRVFYFQLRQSVLSVLSDEIKKITSFFQPNEGEWLFWVVKSFIFCLSPFELMKYSMARRITLLELWTLIGVVFSILKL